jgi:hypothetical protein
MAQSIEGDFNPSVHFLGLLKKAVGDGITRRCSVPGGPQIVVAPQHMAYYSATATPQDLHKLCVAEPFDLQIEALPDWHPDTSKETVQAGRMFMRVRGKESSSAGLTPRPLAELLWLASTSVSQGRLLQGCHADDPVRLKRLPDFSALPHREAQVRLAQFMHESSADLLTVSKRTGIPLTEVFDFHNACAMLGLIERGNIFEPDDYFLGVIQKSLRDGLIRRCTLPDLPPLFIVPSEQRYYSLSKGVVELTPFYAASREDMQIEVVEELDKGGEEEETIQIGRMMVRRKKEGPTLNPGLLEELLWNAALHSSRGRLLAGKNASDVVRLRRWPDFSRLSKDRRLLPLAAFMSANAADLNAIAERTGSPLSVVVDFHNACAVLDYLEYHSAELLQSRRVSEKDRDICRTISKSLSGLKAARHAG